MNDNATQEKVLDSYFPRDQPITFKVNSPFKRALTEMASRRGVNVATMMRQLLNDYFLNSMRGPDSEFYVLYERFKQEEYKQFTGDTNHDR